MTPVRYFLIEDGHRTGPHSLAVLLQKAEVHAITPETPIAQENEADNWSPLRELEVLCGELFSERPHYTLDHHAIERVNNSDNPYAPSISDMLSANLAHQRAAEGELLKPIEHSTNNRRRDYLILCIGGNLLAFLGWLILPGNPVLLISLSGFVVLYNVGIAWVIFGVMGRY